MKQDRKSEALLKEYIRKNAYDRIMEVTFPGKATQLKTIQARLREINDPSIKVMRAVIDNHTILKPNGKILFIEPLCTNPIINLYRKLTPKSRSLDEHPLVNKDLDFIKNNFKETKIKYYGFITLIIFPYYSSV